jgi:D-proline dehydrogenase
MRVAVVGGGITGLFTAYYLRGTGAEVTVFDPAGPGAKSVHAAGILEPLTAYRTNTVAFMRRVWRYWRRGTCTFRNADPRWLFESLRQLERPPPDGAEATLLALGQRSLAAYEALAAAGNDFGYAPHGLVEQYDDPVHFAEERAIALDRRSISPVEVREGPNGTGALFFPKVGWVHTERFVDRLLREIGPVRFVREEVLRLALDGTVTSASGSARYDAVAVCSGVTSRKLGVPLTGVRGYGWHLRLARPVATATIHVDRGIALVPFADDTKATGGWDFDLGTGAGRPARVLAAIRRIVEVKEVLDYRDGVRPCTPDGLPTIGKTDRLVIANGGFRLGWSFAPAMGEAASLLCLGRSRNDPFLARFCGSVRSARLD